MSTVFNYLIVIVGIVFSINLSAKDGSLPSQPQMPSVFLQSLDPTATPVDTQPLASLGAQNTDVPSVQTTLEQLSNLQVTLQAALDTLKTQSITLQTQLNNLSQRTQQNTKIAEPSTLAQIRADQSQLKAGLAALLQQENQVQNYIYNLNAQLTYMKSALGVTPKETQTQSLVQPAPLKASTNSINTQLQPQTPLVVPESSAAQSVINHNQSTVSINSIKPTSTVLSVNSSVVKTNLTPEPAVPTVSTTPTPIPSSPSTNHLQPLTIQQDSTVNNMHNSAVLSQSSPEKPVLTTQTFVKQTSHNSWLDTLEKPLILLRIGGACIALALLLMVILFWPRSANRQSNLKKDPDYESSVIEETDTSAATPQLEKEPLDLLDPMSPTTDKK